jgi:hypothetical protein
VGSDVFIFILHLLGNCHTSISSQIGQPSLATNVPIANLSGEGVKHRINTSLAPNRNVRYGPRH